MPGGCDWSALAGASGPAGVPGGGTPPVGTLPAGTGAGPTAAVAAPAAAAPAASGFASGAAAVSTSAVSGPVAAAGQDRAGEAIVSSAPGERRRRRRGPHPPDAARGVPPPGAHTSADAAAAAAAAERQLIASAIRTAEEERALLVQFHRGDRVTLFGLGTSALNGLTATLLDRAPPSKGSVPRWTVSLPDRDPLRLPIANMRPQREDMAGTAAHLTTMIDDGEPVEAVVLRLTRMVETAMPAKAIAAFELLVEEGLMEEATAAAALWASRGPLQCRGTAGVRLTRETEHIQRVLPHLEPVLGPLAAATSVDADVYVAGRAAVTPEGGGGADEGGALLELARSMVEDAAEARFQAAEAAAKAEAAYVPWNDRPTSPYGAAADDTLLVEAMRCGSCSGPRDASSYTIINGLLACCDGCHELWCYEGTCGFCRVQELAMLLRQP